MKILKTIFAALAIVAVGGLSANADDITETNSAVIEWGFAGTGPVTDGEATLFPSSVTTATTMFPTITSVSVTLNLGAGTGHTFMDDLEMTLEHVASGETLVFLNDAGGSDDVTGDLTFTSGAAAYSDTTGGTGAGTYGVSNFGTVASTAPAGTLTDFDGFFGLDGNSDWNLYVFDDAGGDTGTWDGGWTLNIVTAVPEPTTAGLLAVGVLGFVARRRRR